MNFSGLFLSKKTATVSLLHHLICQTTMSSKFSPKFTIATAYPMMYCPADLQYIEADMVDLITADTVVSSPSELSEPSEPSEPLAPDFGEAETATDFYVWVKNNESHKSHTIRQLERLWQNGSEDSSR